MRRATLAGVETIEHGNDGTPEVFRLMKEHGTVLVPTLPLPAPRPKTARLAAFKAALDAGVTIANGSDVGVFAHGDNAREIAALVESACHPPAALTAATATAARVLHMERKSAACSPIFLADLNRRRGRPVARHRRPQKRALRDEGWDGGKGAVKHRPSTTPSVGTPSIYRLVRLQPRSADQVDAVRNRRKHCL